VSDPLSFDTALSQYEQALDAWQTSQSSSTSLSKDCLRVLLARDAVQAALSEETPTAESLAHLKELDDRLKDRKFLIGQSDDLADWRELRLPPTTSWWWFFEPPTRLRWLEKHCSWITQINWLWKLATIALLAISVTFILSTLSSVLKGGLEPGGTLAVVIQSVLAIAGGSALTQPGKEALESILTRVRIPKSYWQSFTCLLALVLLLLVSGIRSHVLPIIATRLYQQGVAQYETGRLDGALSSYQQAIALRSDYTEAHYALGTLYEDLQKNDLAIAEYQLVIQSDPNHAPNSSERVSLLRAHNNLGRLYILKGNNQAAWIPLERGQSLVDADAAKANADIRYEQYKLLKNLGWVRFQQKYYVEAQDWLKQAIDLQPTIADQLKKAGGQAAPFCLRAQVLEAQKQVSEARKSWDSCVQYAVVSNPDEAQWVGLATEQLEKDIRDTQEKKP
jgi:tetratricopeptide (TPR) repeat protein